MPACLVRLVQNRDIVGLRSRPFQDLVIAVDECTDVPACDHVALPPGGIMWTGPAIPIPVEVDSEDEEAEIKGLPWA
jgi:hypothetical protein